MRKRLGELLVEEKTLSTENLQKALLFQKTGKAKIGRVLTDFGFVSEKTLINALSLQLQIPSIDLQSIEVDHEAMNLISQEDAESRKIFPFV